MKKLNNKGFSLVELIVVVLIMAIIAVALAPQVMKWVEESRKSTDANNYDTIVEAANTALANQEALKESNTTIMITADATTEANRVWKVTTGNPKFEEQMKENGIVANLLNDGETSDNSPWHQAINDDGYPVPDQSHNNENMQDFENIDGVYIISSVADLDTLRKHVENGKRPTYLVYINADIDCEGIDWEPIGTSDHPFSGRCFGGGHTIKNLENTNNYQEKAGQGFFGVVDINTLLYFNMQKYDKFATFPFSVLSFFLILTLF